MSFMDLLYNFSSSRHHVLRRLTILAWPYIQIWKEHLLTAWLTILKLLWHENQCQSVCHYHMFLKNFIDYKTAQEREINIVCVCGVVFPERSKRGAVRKQPGKGQTGNCGNIRAVTTSSTVNLTMLPPPPLPLKKYFTPSLGRLS